MFHLNLDDRLSSWAKFRAELETSQTPFNDVWEFWKSAPFIPYNHKVDPRRKKYWPTPWEIIVENKYDDFTKALMIGWTLKLTNRFQDSKIEIKILVDDFKPTIYNICCIDDQIINYQDSGPISNTKLPDCFLVENIIDLSSLK